MRLGHPGGRDPQDIVVELPDDQMHAGCGVSVEDHMTTAFRLSVLALIGVLAVLPSSGSGPAIAEVSGQLKVVDWPGFDDEEFWSDFKREYPRVEVVFERQPSDAAIYTWIKLGNQADIIHPYSSWLRRWVDEGLVEEITEADLQKLANWQTVPDLLKEKGRFNGKQYFIPWDVGFSSILYRTDKVKGTIDTWSALFDPAYQGHVAMFDDGPSAVSVSAYIRGWKETDITPDRLELIRDEWIDQKKKKLRLWEDESKLIQDMIDDKVWVAYAWPSAYAALKSEGVEVAYADPKEGRASWVGFYGILKGTKNKELALKFLDEKLSGETAKYVVDELSYGIANQSVWRESPNSALKELSLDDPNALRRTNFTPELSETQLDDWAKIWEKVVATR
jgi:spermidine/putrescine transport system substrate-binding protein